MNNVSILKPSILKFDSNLAFVCHINSQTNLEVVSNVARVDTRIRIRKRMVRSILPKTN